MDPARYFDEQFDRHAAVAAATRRDLAEPFAAALRLWAEAVRSGNKLLFFGNGGSAADAQHLAAELVVRFVRDRDPIPAIALTTDTSALTAAGNDLGFDAVFSRQLRALGRPGDVAVGLSTSGRSPNVVHALRQARSLELRTVAFTGGDGGDLPGLAEVLLCVPSDVTARVQEMHICIGHLLCGALEIELGLAR